MKTSPVVLARALVVACVGTAANSPLMLASKLPTPPPAAIADRQDFQPPDRVELAGWIGTRVTGNEVNRLLRIDTDRLLEGYRRRPGRQSWDGEHVGKWLHAATLAWANRGNAALRQKLDRTVIELSKCQLEDGYLGTYLPEQRWTAWDVWAHKYNLIGLLTYVQYTGNDAPFAVCRRMGDLLCRAFGDGPGQRSLLKAGYHAGMAPTSVLEPMVLLHRMTGERRYREFCDYILREWEKPEGPQILSRLLTLKRVDKVGNAKAYEMLSCLNGALEYHRAFGGDGKIVEACLNAWQDIVDKRLYLTGAASHLELFHDDFDLPDSGNVGETCVTVTWLQFNAQLLRLTGEARFAEELEKVTLNQLFGAQKPDCSGWGYYVQMQGIKPYSDTLDGHCCLSSGPRGVALLPTFAVTTDADGVVVNLYTGGRARLALRDGTAVELATDTPYPRGGTIAFTLQPASAASFALKLRIPRWSQDAIINVNGHRVTGSAGPDGYVALRRTWRAGDRVELGLGLTPRVIIGEHRNAGRIALAYGPLILAADQALLTGGTKLAGVAVREGDLNPLRVTPEPPADMKGATGQVFRMRAVLRNPAAPHEARGEVDLRLVPFGDAGGTGGRYAVWLPLLKTRGVNLAPLGEEGSSRRGTPSTSIIDGDPQSIVAAGDGTLAAEDWFAVTLAAPAEIVRVVFGHGRLPRNGGWFDTRAGKPRIQVQGEPGGPWRTVGELADYPATDATKAPALARDARFSVRLAEPVRAVAVRVVGVPSSGNAPKQNSVICGELEVYAD